MQAVELRLFLFVGYALLMLSCGPESPSLNGTWMVGEMHLDENTFTPLPNVLTIRNDSCFLVNMSNLNRDTFDLYLNQDTLYVDTVGYPPDQYSLSAREWVYRKPYAISAFKPKPSHVSLSRIQSRNEIRGKTWSSPWGALFLQEDGQAYLLSEDRSGTHQFCWNIREADTYLFFILHGNHLTCDQFSFPLCQVTKLSPEEISLFYRENGTYHDFTMKPLNDVLTPNPSSFQLCNRHLYENLGAHHYYFKGTELYGGHYYIQKQLDAFFEPVKNGFSGMIRIRFVVNCEGKTGLFHTVAYNTDYKEMDELPREAGMLLEVTQNLGPWTPGTEQGGLEPVDTYCFIAYKLRDGQVVDILP